MTTTDYIEKVYLEYFKDTFDKLGLDKYESSKGTGSSGWFKFKNKAFKVQLLDDRGLIETDISPLFGQEEFRGLEKYNSLLTLKNSKNINESERRKILGTRLDFKDQARFLADHFDKLREILNKDNYRTTLKDIESLGQS